MVVQRACLIYIVAIAHAVCSLFGQSLLMIIYQIISNYYIKYMCVVSKLTLFDCCQIKNAEYLFRSFRLHFASETSEAKNGENENELTTMVLQTSPAGTFCITNRKVVHSFR